MVPLFQAVFILQHFINSPSNDNNNNNNARSTRHRQLNDIIWHALRRADVPAVEESTELILGSDLHPDGLTLITWQGGLAWHGTQQ